MENRIQADGPLINTDKHGWIAVQGRDREAGGEPRIRYTALQENRN